MPNNKWDEDHIENLLQDFPTIKDDRSKEDVYKRLTKPPETKKKPNRWIPLLVAAMAFITFGILLASMLGQQNNESAFDTSGSENLESTEESAGTVSENSEMLEDAEPEENAEMESAAVTESDSAADGESAVEESGAATDAALSGNLEGQNIFTLGLTENAMVIPVSFIISDDKLQDDFGKTDVNAAELYNLYASEVDEESLGFDEYHPYAGTITATDEGIEHILPEEHDYDLASASISVYLNSLAASFGDAEEISVINESGNAASFDQVGPLQPITPSPVNLAYYSYTLPAGESYLVPAYNMPHDNVTEALNAMLASPNDFYESLIPEGVGYIVSETDETVTVEFDPVFDFNSVDPETAVRMIEGLVLTADSFGKQLLITNTATDIWNNYDFTEPLPVPKAINSRNLE